MDPINPSYPPAPAKSNNKVMYGVLAGCGCLVLVFVGVIVMSILFLAHEGNRQQQVFSDIRQQLQAAQLSH